MDDPCEVLTICILDTAQWSCGSSGSGQWQCVLILACHCCCTLYYIICLAQKFNRSATLHEYANSKCTSQIESPKNKFEDASLDPRASCLVVVRFVKPRLI
eukprot:700399-Pleurochrysis_carterae.AAC.2